MTGRVNPGICAKVIAPSASGAKASDGIRGVRNTAAFHPEPGMPGASARSWGGEP